MMGARVLLCVCVCIMFTYLCVIAGMCACVCMRILMPTLHFIHIDSHCYSYHACKYHEPISNKLFIMLESRFYAIIYGMFTSRQHYKKCTNKNPPRLGSVDSYTLVYFALWAIYGYNLDSGTPHRHVLFFLLYFFVNLVSIIGILGKCQIK